MKPHNFNLVGGLPSPKDKRDFKIGQVQAPITIPESYFTDLGKLPVLYQGKQPSCVGHATALALMHADWLELGKVTQLSPRFLYALAKRDDGFDGDGTYYRQCFKEAQEFGVCQEPLFKNDIELDKDEYKDSTRITPDAYTDAQPRVIKSYVRLDDMSLAGIKQAIYQNKLVLLGVKLGKEWWTNTSGDSAWTEKEVLPVRPPVDIISGHAILAYGYDQDYIYFVNSWSKDWGRLGIGYFGKEYMPFVYEGWTFIDLPNSVVENLLQQKSLLEKVVELLKQLIGLKKNV